MFTIDFDASSGDHILVGSEGEKLSVREDVWKRLKDPDEIFSEWKKLLQKWSIHLNMAPLLKKECSSDGDYRSLRTAIRTYIDPS